jgi:thiosulfate dehydrogenase [quinone] large subunit
MNMKSMTERFLFAFRMLMAWTFLYAASHQVLNPKFSAARFLANTKTFHDIYAPLTAPSLDPLLTFLVSYGHLAIGLSLLVGLLVRVSSIAGLVLLMLYWTAHMEWPFIENHNNFIVDYHIVYSAVCLFLCVSNAGHILGADAVAARLDVVRNNRILRFLVG